MEIYLVQHGEAKNKSLDPERPLTDEGSKALTRMGKLVQRLGVSPRRVVHSTKLRARQTAAILAEFVKPPMGVVEMEGLAPLDSAEAFFRGLDSPDGTMVVGHLPFLSRLASLLVVGEVDRPTVGFSYGALIRLVSDDGDRWVVDSVIPTSVADD